MTAINQKHQILESLATLDQSETEQVLAYIRTLTVKQEEATYLRMKREAMSQIRQALNNGRTLNPSF